MPTSLRAAPRIVVVDDDPKVLEFLGDCFKRSGKGYDVETVSSGADSLEAVRRSRPDLVLLDIALPDLNGLDVLKLIRTIDARVPVIMITGTRDAKAAAEAIALGAFAYIPKPLEVAYIDNLVAAALKARP